MREALEEAERKAKSSASIVLELQERVRELREENVGEARVLSRMEAQLRRREHEFEAQREMMSSQLEAAILTNKRTLARTRKQQNLGWILHVTALGLVAWLVISVTSMRAEVAGLKDQVNFLENAASFLMGEKQGAKNAKTKR